MKKFSAIFLSLLLCMSLLATPKQALRYNESNSEPAYNTSGNPNESGDTEDSGSLIMLCSLPGYDHESH